MKLPKRMLLACMGIVAAVSLGCDKKVKLTFVNHTRTSRDVQLAGPGIGRTDVGIIAADGGKLQYGTLKVDKDLLPATYQWWAGNLTGRFTIRESTPKKVWVDIKRNAGGLRDKDTEVEEKKRLEVKEVPIYEDTVVE